MAWRVAAAPRHWTRKPFAGLHWQVRTGHTGYYFELPPSGPGIRFMLLV